MTQSRSACKVCASEQLDEVIAAAFWMIKVDSWLRNGEDNSSVVITVGLEG